MHPDIASSTWFTYLDLDLQRMVMLSLRLYERQELSLEQYDDYTFVVFPMSKAYEGFLKHFLLNTQLISQETFNDRKFRIGRALNPDVSPRHRDEHWLYEDVVRYCSAELARELWETWLRCRNRIFHYFPKDSQVLTLPQAGEYLKRMQDTMHEAVTCQISLEKE
ncbi:MAG TPA: hypothetical protein PKJ26_02915 [Candidatus Woesebacteria bacterium]|jgi:hypothetical protein|nr:hypothetical protein [Candidatus Woesebacteria bacterium]HNS65421.1 hypothetical protein [Candidatus Woesebacteria bacterium]